jgi:hypothetical protein
VILRARKRPFAETGKRSSNRSNSNKPQNVSPLEALSAHVLHPLSHVSSEPTPVKPCSLDAFPCQVHAEQREATTYIVHNADTTPRQVVLEHPIRNGWKLLHDAKPEESSATRYRFRLPEDRERRKSSPSKSAALRFRELTSLILPTISSPPMFTREVSSQN